MEEINKDLANLEVEDGTEWVQNKVLGQNLQVKLQDGREIYGKLQCLDHLGNVVLIETDEYIPAHEAKRALGSAIIPKSAIHSVYLIS